MSLVQCCKLSDKNSVFTLFMGHSFCFKVDWVNYLTTHLVDDVASHLR
jgi:hypothetical protein